MINTYKHRLAQLIAIPSVSCTHPDWDMSNRGVCELLAEWFDRIGFQCELQAVPDSPGKFNMLAVKGQGNGGLVLAGHSDTVPCNPELWQQDPFQLMDRDQRFYGLGATDMKGFFPIVLAALEQLSDREFLRPVIVLATADEESSMSGARALVDQDRPKARYAVIGEPTGMRPVRMHKGILMDGIRLTGQAGHSSNPALGRNALEAMSVVMADLLTFRSELQQRHRHSGFAVDAPTLNLGCIHGGDNPNRICGQCELHFDLRFLPGMKLNDLRAEIQQRIAPIADRYGVTCDYRHLFEGIESFEQNANTELVRMAEELTGDAAESAAYGTEAPFFQELGMETIVLGPGSIDQAHQPDEYIDQKYIEPAINVIRRLVEKTCLS